MDHQFGSGVRRQVAGDAWRSCTAGLSSLAVLSPDRVRQPERETTLGRALLKTQTTDVKPGGTPGRAEPFLDKLNGMRWLTYYCLQPQAEEMVDRSWPPWAIKTMTDSSSRIRAQWQEEYELRCLKISPGNQDFHGT
jgi:hypothetical protein